MGSFFEFTSRSTLILHLIALGCAEEFDAGRFAVRPA